ncbi:glycosyltransferase [Candidatus Uhrbacteria bacterium]|nr:glycosyltransferase [Candidatus Uhrbacteria bacterium]
MKAVLVIPTHNEALVIATTLARILDTLSSEEQLRAYEWTVVVSDNASTDKTREIVQEWEKKDGRVRLLSSKKKGKGGAIQRAWLRESGDLFLFLDADLSAGPEQLVPLLAALETDDIAIGTRWMAGAHVTRSRLRSFVSWGYNVLARHILNSPVSDLQCGCKGVRESVVRRVVPTVKDQRWFFDTELILRAHQAGLSVSEVPIRWVETVNQARKSKVDVWRTCKSQLSALYVLRNSLSAEEILPVTVLWGWLRVLAVAGILAALFLAAALVWRYPFLTTFERMTEKDIGDVFAVLILLSVSYGLLVALPPLAIKKRFFLGVTGLSLVCILVLLFSSPLISVDIGAYAGLLTNWVQTGANPYTIPLSEASLSVRGLIGYPFWIWLTTPYGPLFFLTLLPAAIAIGGGIIPTIIAIKGLMFAAWIGSVLFLYRLTKKEAPWQALLLFVLNPAVLLHIVMDGHNDALILVSVLGFLWYAEQGKQGRAAALLSAAAAIKFFPIILAPALLVRSKQMDRSSVVPLSFFVPTIFFLSMSLFGFPWSGLWEGLATIPAVCIYVCTPIQSILIFLGGRGKLIGLAFFALCYGWIGFQFLWRRCEVERFGFWVVTALLFLAVSWLPPWYLVLPITLAILQHQNSAYRFMIFLLTSLSLLSIMAPMLAYIL